MNYKKLRILLLSYAGYARHNTDDNLMIAYFKELIRLTYFEEEHRVLVNKAGKIFSHELEFELNRNFPIMSDREKDRNIYIVFGAIYNRFHPVRNSVETMDSIEMFRVWDSEPKNKSIL